MPNLQDGPINYEFAIESIAWHPKLLLTSPRSCRHLMFSMTWLSGDCEAITHYILMIHIIFILIKPFSDPS